jgi:hypothetical protein
MSKAPKTVDMEAEEDTAPVSADEYDSQDSFIDDSAWLSEWLHLTSQGFPLAEDNADLNELRKFQRERLEKEMAKATQDVPVMEEDDKKEKQLFAKLEKQRAEKRKAEKTAPAKKRARVDTSEEVSEESGPECEVVQLVKVSNLKCEHAPKGFLCLACLGRLARRAKA